MTRPPWSVIAATARMTRGPPATPRPGRRSDGESNAVIINVLKCKLDDESNVLIINVLKGI